LKKKMETYKNLFLLSSSLLLMGTLFATAIIVRYNYRRAKLIERWV